ncbi:PAS modulated sigma54-dependent transcriptional regulator [Desulfonema limicola]|uniref:HTH-type transcriptional regulatory protein TyrR n=1 Tax=Desulfonema limicola TaxID=45656 RepID=A0A975BBT3_9BACT|nr:sigma 54-interacting transcriptional regulator [Desulfonema limicola]QTA82478.1 PAS modulated sigma54-dependent transcriptional regulator [Desulfonema limicola]
MEQKSREFYSSIFVFPHHSIQEAASVLQDAKTDAVPVIDDENRMVGILTARHIIAAVSNGRSPSDPAESIMEDVSNCNDTKTDEISEKYGMLNESDGIVKQKFSQKKLVENIAELYRNFLSETEAIFNSTHNLIISIDLAGRVKLFNKSAEKFFGKKFEDVYNREIEDIYPESRLRNVALSGTSEILQKIRINDKLFLSNRSPIVDKTNRVIGAVAILQDISELESISDELSRVKKLNREFDAIFESSFDGIWLSDGEGKVLNINRASEKIFGFSRDQLIGKYPTELLKKGVYSRSSAVRAIEKKKTVTTTLTTRDGKTIIAASTPVFDEKNNISLVVNNIRDATHLFELQSELDQMRGLTELYKNKLKQVEVEKGFVHRSARMKEIISLAIRLAKVECSVLITGPSGVGKELIADIIHSNSERKNGPFIKVNCGAIPDNLMESELFGYESGAFSGANRSGKLGYFALAHKGTLLLDEIGELPLQMQVKLLRAVQDKSIIPLGGTKSVKVDIRILAATNRNLKDMIADNEFREDLYYRLNVATIPIPALNERREDILPLIEHFLSQFNRKYKKNVQITNEVIDYWCRYDWQGNVRQLENTVERVVVSAQDQLVTTHDLKYGAGKNPLKNREQEGISLPEAVAQTERKLIQRVFQQCKTTREMARKLRIHQSTLIRKAAKYGIKK